MKKLFYLFVLVMFAGGCEQPVDETEFPYEPKIVIRSLVQENRILDSIYIGRTLPVGVKFEPQFAYLTDAVGVVFYQNETYPLRHTGNGYYTTDSLYVERGNTLSLLVNWDTRTAFAETTVPQTGTLTDPTIAIITGDEKTYSVLQSTITPFRKEAFGATWVVLGFNGRILYESKEFNGIVKAEAIGSSTSFNLSTTEISQSLLSGNLGYPGIRVFIYDHQYFDYYNSLTTKAATDAVFGQPGTNVRWNVRGDGIGMFIARIDTIRYL